uniref:Uncharacterized protein n=1 Tax=uncultured bacterium contig00062 TaxID=1181545 RepID=A0A806KG01_9BACT|nr:hypothetical protein [uncultured bacterium contig00062]
MITDSLAAELKLYIKEHYKLVSFTGLFPGKKLTRTQGISKKAKGVMGKSFSEVSDLMTGFLKEKRDYETFAFVLEKLREEKGLSATDLYKAAWIDKRLYSKIMTTGNYRPAKNTAISFGLALKLKPEEFTAFLQNAGFALSESSIFDLVIRFCVERQIFDLHDVNALLLQADQKTLAKEAA